MADEKRSERDWKGEAAAWRARAEHLQATVDRLRSLAVVGESAGFLAHELNNLFTPVVGYCHAARGAEGDEALRRKAIEKSLAAAERVSALAGSILRLSGSAGEGVVGECELAGAVDGTLMLLDVERWGREGVGVRVDVPRGTLVGAREGVVQQVVMNLVLNARRAMAGRRGMIDIRCSAVGGVARMEVRDAGGGMTTEVMGRVFSITSDEAVTGGAAGAGAGAARVCSDSGCCNRDTAGGSGGGGASRHVVDVQELARSGSINGQARWGVRVRGANVQRSTFSVQMDAAQGAAARRKIASLSGGKVAASMSPIKVWDAREVAEELRGGGNGEEVQRSTFNVQTGEEAGGDVSGRTGSGLGVALCLELVSRVGGRMWAESKVGEGTVVVVEWPRAEGERGVRAA